MRSNLEYASTGHAGLDARLGGGIPRGHVSELVGPRSSRRTTMMLRAIAAATRRGELVALVDALTSFGYDRRSARWQAEQAARPAGELFTATLAAVKVEEQDRSPLRPMTEGDASLPTTRGLG